tara:strand:+ start:26542 stop:27591 length:1050 start_codon:yes stop_codon:yes gene_type:complete
MNFDQIEKQKTLIKNKIAKGVLLSPREIPFEDELSQELKSYIKAWYQRVYDFDFIDVESFEEQIFHSPDHIQINASDKRLFDGVDSTQEDFQLALELMCLKKSIKWNTSSPFVSFDIKIKSRQYRATLLHHSLCKEHGSKLFLRSQSNDVFPLKGFYDQNFLKNMVASRKNVLICGPTGSGKTSLLNSMLNSTSSEDHLLVLEDTYEILSPHENTTRLLAKEENDLKDFMSYAMRMSPDRIVLGELRSKEVESFLLAMNSGHRGLMSTVHANSAADAVSRVALLTRLYSQNALDYSLVLKLVAQNIDYVLYMENKKVVEVIELFGSEADQLFYERLDKKMAAQKAAIGF